MLTDYSKDIPRHPAPDDHPCCETEMRLLPALLTRAMLVAAASCLAGAPAGAEPIAQLDVGGIGGIAVPPGMAFAEAPAHSATETVPAIDAASNDDMAPAGNGASASAGADGSAAPATGDDAPTRRSRPAASSARPARPDSGNEQVTAQHAALPALAASPLLAEEQAESDWEREIKEALRPIYDELAASGVVDAVQGIKSYLGLLNALVAHEGTSAESASGDHEALPESVAGTPAYGTATRGSLGEGESVGRTPAQSERERMIAVLILKEWIAAAKPWFFALLAAYVLWQTIRFAVNYSQWKTRRARKRAARGQRSQRGTRRRSASA